MADPIIEKIVDELMRDSIAVQALRRQLTQILTYVLIDYKKEKGATTMMKYFEYKHLPEKLQGASKVFFDMATFIDKNIPNCAEKSAGLRKLLEAKDCIVRASMEELTNE